jgi:hypothetical protein
VGDNLEQGEGEEVGQEEGEGVELEEEEVVNSLVFKRVASVQYVM